MSYFNKGIWDRLSQVAGAKRQAQAFDGPGFAPPEGVDFGHGELEIVGHEGDLSNSTGPWKFFLNDGRVAIIDDSRSAPYIEGSDEQFYDEEDPNSDALPFNEALDIYLSTRANKQAQVAPLQVLRYVRHGNGGWAAFLSDGRAIEVKGPGDPGSWADTGQPVSPREWESLSNVVDK